MSLAADAAAFDLPTETEVQRIRRRIAAARCPTCTAPVRGRRVLCVACAATLGYCPKCERVMPHAAMAAPSGARRRLGAPHNGACRACEVQRRAHVPPATCKRCKAPCSRGRRLCPSCAAEWGYCPKCCHVKRLCSFRVTTAGRPERSTYCRRCDARRQAERLAQRKEAA